MIAAMYDWSGFYIGVNGGWGSSRKCWDQHRTRRPFVRAAEGCHDATGGTAGGQIGYRWQAGAWVFGLEAQGNWADLQGLQCQPRRLWRAHDNRTKIDAFGLFTGQIGYAWNNVLLYVKGGAAVTDDRYEGFNTATGVLSVIAPNETRWGGTVGVGLEYGFTPNWSAAIEYDHLFMGNATYNFTSLLAARLRTRAPTASARTSISSPSASTIAGAARSSRSTELRCIDSHIEKAGLAPAFLLCARGYRCICCHACRRTRKTIR